MRKLFDMRNSTLARTISVLATMSIAAAASAADPFADQVVSYTPGTNAAPGFLDPATSLGSPERVTGELAGFPGNVTPFNSPFGTDELVSIGQGGSLTVAFDEPIVDRASNEFGVDLIIFGNGFFIFDQGGVGGLFDEGPFSVSVSADGINFFEVGTDFSDGFFPTLGFQDSVDPFGADGSVPTDFTKPVDPSLTVNDFTGLDVAGISALYNGSGGGIPIDISGTGLTEASFVRIDVTADISPEIDAFAAVPEPTTAAIFAVGLMFIRRR